MVLNSIPAILKVCIFSNLDRSRNDFVNLQLSGQFYTNGPTFERDFEEQVFHIIECTILIKTIPSPGELYNMDMSTLIY